MEATWCFVPIGYDPIFNVSDDGAWSGNWGDPHIATPDLNRYSFQAVGDYLLTKSTEPDDTFEVQVRYAPFESGGKQWSGENALAMMVGDTKVEFYAQTGGVVDIYINEVLTDINPGDLLAFRGGIITHQDDKLLISWLDGTLLEASLDAPDPTREVRGFTRIYFPGSRRNHVQGLLGNFDGNPDNDFQIRDGEVLDNPTEGELYLGGYRESWSIDGGASDSLFSQGDDPYDATYPTDVIRLSDLPSDEAAAAEQLCRDQGIVDFFLLRACTIDVVVTENPAWADVTADMASGIDLTVPSITVNPAAARLVSERSREFGAIVRGTSDTVVWSATGGTVSGSGNVITYTAPSTAGTYTLTARLASNPSVNSRTTVLVVSGVNTPPVAVDDRFGFDVFNHVGDWLTFKVLANDSDADGDSLTIVDVEAPSFGQIDIADDGQAILYNPEDFSQPEQVVSYIISDERGGTATAQLTIYGYAFGITSDDR